MKLTTLNVVSPVASISLLIGSDVHHFVFTVLYLYNIYMDSNTDHFTIFTLRVQGKNVESTEN